MPLSAQTRLGPYEILSPLGAGGMGEVYRARDTKLGRDVAVKVLPAAFAQDADRMARFAHEAQVLASLNHPGIAAIYGLEEGALVMELVEGPTLGERIQPGPIPLPEALLIAREIAEALEYAHEKGIVHRDLKPANIKVTPEGRAKILDFGLAKALGNNPVSGDPISSPTLTMRATEAGVVLGTAAYMSPEQARGGALDKRSDIWSFGVVLYEMLTGRRLFAGETVSDTLAAVLRAEPDWSALPRETPMAIRRLLRRCLERDRKRRLSDIADARLEIDEGLVEPPERATTAKPSMRALYVWAGLAILSCAVALILAAVHFRETQPETAAVRFQIPAPEKTTFSVGGMALSPDGRRLAFVAVRAGGGESLWVRALDSLAAHELAGTEGALFPFWSPDSRFIGFFAASKLKKIEASGGPAQTVCDVPGFGVGGSWNRDGVIIFGTGATGLFRVLQAGGTVSPLTTPDRSQGEGNHVRPWFLPDGSHLLYHASNSNYLTTLNGKDRKRLVGATQAGAYAPASERTKNGYLLFLREGTLMAQPLEAKRFDLAGEAFPLAEQVGSARAQGFFSVSASGVLAYRSTYDRGNHQLTWFDREGRSAGIMGTAADYNNVVLSPDGKRLAITKRDSQTRNDLWLVHIARNAFTKFTFDPANEGNPVWSPQGDRLVFTSDRDGRSHLYQKHAGGNANEEPLLKDDALKRSYDWSDDGRFLLYGVLDQKTGTDLWVLPLEGERKPMPFLVAPYSETQGQFSPGPGGAPRWVAYSSDESGRHEVYVQPFPAGSRKFQISTGGGSQPRWRRDGKELYYLSAEGKLMAVEVKTSPEFDHAVPKELFETRLYDRGSIVRPDSGYAVAPDGKRFLIITQAEQTASAPITVVLNWQAALKR